MKQESIWSKEDQRIIDLLTKILTYIQTDIQLDIVTYGQTDLKGIFDPKMVNFARGDIGWHKCNGWGKVHL